MTIWNELREGDELTVRPKRGNGRRERVVVTRVLERTIADGQRFIDAEGRLITRFEYDLRPATDDPYARARWR